VPPTDMFLIFFVGILCIQQKKIRAVQKLDQFRALADGKLAGLLGASPSARGGVELAELIRLIVGNKRNRAGTSKEPIASKSVGLAILIKRFVVNLSLRTLWR